MHMMGIDTDSHLELIDHIPFSYNLCHFIHALFFCIQIAVWYSLLLVLKELSEILIHLFSVLKCIVLNTFLKKNFIFLMIFLNFLIW